LKGDFIYYNNFLDVWVKKDYSKKKNKSSNFKEEFNNFSGDHVYDKENKTWVLKEKYLLKKLKLLKKKREWYKFHAYFLKLKYKYKF